MNDPLANAIQALRHRVERRIASLTGAAEIACARGDDAISDDLIWQAHALETALQHSQKLADMPAPELDTPPAPKMHPRRDAIEHGIRLMTVETLMMLSESAQRTRISQAIGAHVSGEHASTEAAAIESLLVRLRSLANLAMLAD